MDKASIVKALRDTAQAASNTAASTVSGPIDLLAAALRYGGIPVPENAFGGSKWMAERGLTQEVEQGVPRAVGETLGMVGPALATQFAPQIAGAINKGAANLAAPTRLNKETGAIVWHGSPHKFDKFDSSKIGTGEGAQAYGHGLYLAENPSVAREYQEKLSSVGGAKNLAAQYGDIDKGIAEAQRRIASYKELIANGGGGAMERAQRMLNLSEKNLQDLSAMKAGLPENTGALYKVDLPDEQIAKMLDWDKPLSQQAPEVRSALRSMTDDVLAGGFDLSRAARNPKLAFDNSARVPAFEQLKAKYGITESGGQFFDKGGRPIPRESVERQIEKLAGKGYERAGDLYSDLAHIVGSQAQVSSVMRNQGIPGIRYLDGGSRGTGAGTSNFVVFPGNENVLSILERNGQPLGLMGVR